MLLNGRNDLNDGEMMMSRCSQDSMNPQLAKRYIQSNLLVFYNKCKINYLIKYINTSLQVYLVMHGKLTSINVGRLI